MQDHETNPHIVQSSATRLTHEPMAATTPVATSTIPTQAATHGLSPEQIGALSSIIPAEAIADPVKLAHSLQVLQQLASMGIPTERWPQIMQIMNTQQPASAIPIQAHPTATTPQATTPAQAPVQTQAPVVPQPYYAQPPPIQVPAHVPANVALGSNSQVQQLQQTVLHGQRSRSRSPVQRSPAVGQEHKYRQRSPLRSNSDLQGDIISVSEPKWTGHDPNLPPNHIKVLSRTLFVGGVK